MFTMQCKYNQIFVETQTYANISNSIRHTCKDYEYKHCNVHLQTPELIIKKKLSPKWPFQKWLYLIYLLRNVNALKACRKLTYCRYVLNIMWWNNVN